MLHKKRIATSLVFSFISESINKLTPFIVYSLAMQRLGAAMFGQAQVAMAVIEVTVPLVLLASHIVGVMETGRMLREGRPRPSIMLTLTVGRIALGLLVSGGLLLFGKHYEPWASFSALLLPLCLLVLPLTNEASCVMLGSQKVKIFSTMQVCGRLLSLLAIVFLVRDAKDADLYALLSLGANALISVLTLAWSWNRDDWRWEGWAYFAEVWRKSLLLGIPLVLVTIQDRIDLFFAHQLFGDAAAGVYALAMRFMQAFINLQGPIAAVFYSEMVRVASRDDLRQHARWEFYGLVSLYLPLAVGGSILAEPLLQLLFGAEAGAGASCLMILMWVPLVQVAYLVYGQQMLSLEGRHRYLGLLTLLGVCVTLVAISLLYAASERLEVVAIASLLGKLVVALAVIYPTWRSQKRLIWSDIRASLGSAALMATCLIVFDISNVLLAIALGAGVYLASFLVWERERLKQVIASRRRNRAAAAETSEPTVSE